jgi:hypothetical protein
MMTAQDLRRLFLLLAVGGLTYRVGSPDNPLSPRLSCGLRCALYMLVAFALRRSLGRSNRRLSTLHLNPCNAPRTGNPSNPRSSVGYAPIARISFPGDIVACLGCPAILV